MRIAPAQTHPRQGHRGIHGCHWVA